MSLSRRRSGRRSPVMVKRPRPPQWHLLFTGIGLLAAVVVAVYVGWDAPAGEDAAVYPRVQGLYSPVHDLRKARILSDFRDRKASILNRLIGAPCRKNIHAALMELIDELCNVALVRDAYERASNGQLCHVVNSVLVLLGLITQLYPERELVRLESDAVTLGRRDG